MLEELWPDLREAVGEEELRTFSERHKMLKDGLSKAKVPASLSVLFPRSAAADILQWYLRWVSGLMELRAQAEGKTNKALGNSAGRLYF